MLTNESIEKRAREILSTLTLKEKIGQLTQVHFSIEETDKLKQEIADGKVGSVILSDTAFAGSEGKMLGGGTYVDEMQKTAVEKSKSKIPVIFGRDVIHGHKAVLPIPLAMSASFNFELVKEAYADMAEEALKDGVEFSVTVKNTGNYAAKEVVQCYIRDCKSSMTRPIKELKGAKKVFLDKGESKEIYFTLTDKDLGFYGRNGKFTIESGEFIIYIGENAHTDRSIKLTVEQ